MTKNKEKVNPKFDPFNCKNPIEGKIVISVAVTFDDRIKLDTAHNGEYIGHTLPDGTEVRPIIAFILEKDGKETVVTCDRGMADLAGVELTQYIDSYYEI